MNKLLKARVIKTGETIQVYKHQYGEYIDYADCDTEYKEKEIAIIK